MARYIRISYNVPWAWWEGTWRHNTWTNNDVGRDFYPIIDFHGNQKPVSGKSKRTNLLAELANIEEHDRLEIYDNTFTSNVGGDLECD